MPNYISDVDTLKSTLERYGIKPNKALGQNFFIDNDKLAAIADATCSGDKNVLEIGPGPGALTELLLERAYRVVAVEKDRDMAAILSDRLGSDSRLTVVTADALRYKPKDDFDDASFAVAGNLPYYITTPIAERYMAMEPASMTLMVQKEAAERFFAGVGDRVYGPLSAVTAVFYRAVKLMDIPRSCYWPQPEVDSAVVQLTRDGTMGKAGTAKAFFAFLNSCFAMRRKTLINNLGRTDLAKEVIAGLGLKPDVRAEAIEPHTLYQLFLALRQE